MSRRLEELTRLTGSRTEAERLIAIHAASHKGATRVAEPKKAVTTVFWGPAGRDTVNQQVRKAKNAARAQFRHSVIGRKLADQEARERAELAAKAKLIARTELLTSLIGNSADAASLVYKHNPQLAAFTR